MQIAVIGAGPIGLEAALAAQQRGHRVVVLERGEVGDTIRAWRDVRLFTPWSMNTTGRGREAAHFDQDLAAYPTGQQLVDHYLVPIAATLEVHPHTDVVQVTRATLRKGDALGSAQRAEEPFVLLVDGPKGEQVLHADVVLDCSGTFLDPAPAGPGGALVPGERAAREAGRIHYGPGAQPAGESILLVGDGASATTVLQRLLETKRNVSWITPSPAVPGFQSPADDVLPQRRALFDLGARAPQLERVEHLPSQWIRKFELLDGGLRAHLDDDRFVDVDAAVVCTGFRPRHDLARELQVHVCWGSEGPMKLAAALLSSQGDGGGDCLDAVSAGPEVLRSPEPRYFILGAKSYGRRSDFLLKIGHEQVDEVLTLL